MRKTVSGRGLHEQKPKLYPELVLWMYYWPHLLKREAGFSVRQLCSYFSSTSHSSELTCTAGPPVPPQGCKLTGFRWPTFYRQAVWHTQWREEKNIRRPGSCLTYPLQLVSLYSQAKMIIWLEFAFWVWYSDFLRNKHLKTVTVINHNGNHRHPWPTSCSILSASLAATCNGLEST